MKTVVRIALILALPAVLAGLSLAATGHPGDSNERFVIRATDQIHAAQMTYGATVGNGSFGSLADLYEADLIDAALASGNKYRYSFVMSVTPGSPNAPASFVLTATPHRYPKTGRRSFFIDTSGEMHGGDKNGAVATASDPYIDSCALWGTADNERCAIRALRTLHGAENTYQATYGNGNFGSLFQLGEAALINRILATGLVHGYALRVTFVNPGPDLPASFKIYATPQTYRTTGIRSFFVDTSGVLRGADKSGVPADENDPPIDQ